MKYGVGYWRIRDAMIDAELYGEITRDQYYNILRAMERILFD